MRFVALANPESNRARFFQQALEALGEPAATIVPWLAFLREPRVLADALGVGPCVLRIESVGKNFEVERELIALGAEGSLVRPITAAAARALEPEKGRLRHVRQAHLGFLWALERVDELLATGGDVRVMSPPAAIRTMFDKRLCHRACAVAGVPVPEALGEEVGSYAELRAQLKARRMRRVFVKSAHSSSAAGVVALATAPGKVAAHTTVELVEDEGEVRLYNSRKIRRYTQESQVATIVDRLCEDGVHVERWVPKESLEGRSCDLRQVVIAGRARHTVVRTSDTPLTNLHLLNPRGELDAFKELVGEERWTEIQRVSEAATRAMGDPLYAGVDVCVSKRKREPHVLEVNAFGDLLPRVLDGGHDTYAAEIVALRDQP